MTFRKIVVVLASLVLEVVPAAAAKQSPMDRIISAYNAQIGVSNAIGRARLDGNRKNFNQAVRRGVINGHKASQAGQELLRVRGNKPGF